VEVAAGDQLNTGQTLLTLYPAEGMEIRAKIPATHQAEILDRLGRRQPLRASLRVAGQRIDLRLARVAGAADTRGLDAFFVLERANPDLRVGSLVTLSLERAPVDTAVALPYTALYNGTQVYRVRDGRLGAVKVQVLGEQEGGGLLVASSELRAGDQIMTTHLPNAVGGLRVEAQAQARKERRG
jgi:hypothetical protein